MKEKLAEQSKRAETVRANKEKLQQEAGEANQTNEVA